MSGISGNFGVSNPFSAVGPDKSVTGGNGAGSAKDVSASGDKGKDVNLTVPGQSPILGATGADALSAALKNVDLSSALSEVGKSEVDAPVNPNLAKVAAPEDHD